MALAKLAHATDNKPLVQARGPLDIYIEGRIRLDTTRKNLWNLESGISNKVASRGQDILKSIDKIFMNSASFCLL